MEILGPGVVDVIDFITQIGDFRQVVGNVGGVVGHLIIGFLQLRTVHRIGAGVAQLTRGHVGDLRCATPHMIGTIGIKCCIPLQRIILQPVNVSGVSGHLLVSGVQLRAVYRIGAGVTQFTCGNVGDLRCATTHMVGTIGIKRGIPLQRIVLQPVNIVGVIRHLNIGCVQLRAIDGVSTGGGYVASSNVGHFLTTGIDTGSGDAWATGHGQAIRG
ncbi:Uncharacterised protein [Serratia fonticola]|nr:Uncharacterised protein [Serratia fonticola]